MLHIRPIEEKDASEKVQLVYKDIKETLNIHFVPLLFQYIAGFEEYFLYAWEKYKTNLESDYYKKATQQLIEQAQKSILSVYRESKAMQQFVGTLQQHEKEQLLKTANELTHLNATLLLLTIALREGVKGVVIGQQLLPKDIGYEETIFDAFINEKIMHANIKNAEKEIAPASKMLAPLFGGSTIVVSKYPAFFGQIAREMEELAKTEKFLHERVIMEQQSLIRATNLPYPLGCTYAEIALFAGKRPYFSELLYILSETFPTQFPRLLFTTAVMRQVVSSGKAVV